MSTTPRPSQRIVIEAKFGSPTQRNVGVRTLKEFLAAWKEQVEAMHKKTRVDIVLPDE